MCLLLMAVDEHPGFPLVVAANRDEFHERPTEPADWWPDRPLLGGRDLRAGGTWFAVDRLGRFAAVTNVRDPARRLVDPPASRGELPVRALESGADDRTVESLRDGMERYDGFNLIFGGAGGVFWLSNRGGTAGRLASGVHGLSNHLVDTPWPKVTRGRAALAAQLQRQQLDDPEPFFDLLYDRRTAPDADLPDTGVGLPLERRLSPLFIVGETYGTRCSTVLLVSTEGRVTFAERRFDPDGRANGTTVKRFTPHC
ncbi:MAG TPA: NRDE family protein [Gammaproteobacteria bacterium]|nr:NRDE family protein [Gammaproteobacteria bacterium]